MSNHYDLERKVLAFLQDVYYDELPIYLEQINDEEWAKDNQKVLQIMRRFASSDDSKRVAKDWLIDSDISFDLIDILQAYIPPIEGKRYFRDLLYQKEELRIKKTLKRLETQPLKEIKPALQKILKTPISIYKPKDLLQVSRQRISEMKMAKEAPNTGYLCLDRFIKGFINGNLYVLSGATNAGKTQISANFAYNVARQQKKVLYFALEPENTIVNYLASIIHRKRYEDLNEEDLLLDNSYIQVFGKDNITYIEDLVKAIYTIPRYDLIIIDHIGYFTSDGSNTFHKQSDVMKQLAGLAKDRQSAILLVQHLNKAKTNKGNPEDNITGSAAFKQDATDVMLLVRDTEQDEYGATKMLDTGAILVRKTKSGGGEGVVKLKFIEGSAVILDDSKTPDLF